MKRHPIKLKMKCSFFVQKENKKKIISISFLFTLTTSLKITLLTLPASGTWWNGPDLWNGDDHFVSGSGIVPVVS